MKQLILRNFPPKTWIFFREYVDFDLTLICERTEETLYLIFYTQVSLILCLQRKLFYIDTFKYKQACINPQIGTYAIRKYLGHLCWPRAVYCPWLATPASANGCLATHLSGLMICGVPDRPGFVRGQLIEIY